MSIKSPEGESAIADPVPLAGLDTVPWADALPVPALRSAPARCLTGPTPAPAPRPPIELAALRALTDLEPEVRSLAPLLRAYRDRAERLCDGGGPPGMALDEEVRRLAATACRPERVNSVARAAVPS